MKWKRSEDRRFKRRQTKSKKQKTKKQKAQSTISENCWLEVIWKKEKKKKKKWEKKWDYIDEKMNDWSAERKVNNWDAKFYEAARSDRKNVVSMRDNWLRTTKLYDFDNFDDEELENEFDHLIDDRIRSDSQWYKTMIRLSWWCKLMLSFVAMNANMCDVFSILVEWCYLCV